MAGRLTISTLNNDTGVLATQNGMTGIAKAWVVFNGSTGAVNGTSFNVSSVTVNGSNDYTVNFTTAMPNVNYAYGGMVMAFAAVNAVGYTTGRNSGTGATTADKTTNSIRFLTINSAGGASTFGEVAFQAFSS
jgi:hypothetical protein